MPSEELLKRLSVVHQDTNPGPGYKIVLLDADDRGGDQIGLEDGPNEIILEFSDEALLENAELDEVDARLLQKHKGAVIQWLKDQGFNPIVDDHEEAP